MEAASWKRRHRDDDFRAERLTYSSTEEFITAASAPENRCAQVVSLGPVGARQCDLDKLIRALQSKGAALVLVY